MSILLILGTFDKGKKLINISKDLYATMVRLIQGLNYFSN